MTKYCVHFYCDMQLCWDFSAKYFFYHFNVVLFQTSTFKFKIWKNYWILKIPNIYENADVWMCWTKLQKKVYVVLNLLILKTHFWVLILPTTTTMARSACPINPSIFSQIVLQISIFLCDWQKDYKSKFDLEIKIARQSNICER